MRRCTGERRGLRLPRLGGRSIGVAALDGHHGGNGVFEDQLFLVVGLEHQEYLSQLLIRPDSLTPLSR